MLLDRSNRFAFSFVLMSGVLFLPCWFSAPTINEPVKFVTFNSSNIQLSNSFVLPAKLCAAPVTVRFRRAPFWRFAAKDAFPSKTIVQSHGRCLATKKSIVKICRRAFLPPRTASKSELYKLVAHHRLILTMTMNPKQINFSRSFRTLFFI